MRNVFPVNVIEIEWLLTFEIQFSQSRPILSTMFLFLGFFWADAYNTTIYIYCLQTQYYLLLLFFLVKNVIPGKSLDLHSKCG